MDEQKTHYIIKAINIDKEEFIVLKKHTKKRYSQLSRSKVTYKQFEAWTLCAMVLGVFGGYGDKEATYLFYKYLLQNKLPNIYILDFKKFVKICICIIENKINEQPARTKNITKSS